MGLLTLFIFLFPEIDFSQEESSFTGYTIEEKIESDRLIEQEMEDINAFLDTLLN